MAGEKYNQVNAASQAGKACPMAPVEEAAQALIIKGADRSGHERKRWRVAEASNDSKYIERNPVDANTSI
jgi:hypothetical protein